jgi:hypothetical protein
MERVKCVSFESALDTVLSERKAALARQADALANLQLKVDAFIARASAALAEVVKAIEKRKMDLGLEGRVSLNKNDCPSLAATRTTAIGISMVRRNCPCGGRRSKDYSWSLWVTASVLAPHYSFKLHLEQDATPSPVGPPEPPVLVCPVDMNIGLTIDSDGDLVAQLFEEWFHSNFVAVTVFGKPNG